MPASEGGEEAGDQILAGPQSLSLGFWILFLVQCKSFEGFSEDYLPYVRKNRLRTCKSRELLKGVEVEIKYSSNPGERWIDLD